MNLPAFHDSPLAHMTPEQRLVFLDGAKRRAAALRRQAISDAMDALGRALSRALSLKSRRAEVATCPR
jgi:hypothetical protein